MYGSVYIVMQNILPKTIRLFFHDYHELCVVVCVVFFGGGGGGGFIRKAFLTPDDMCNDVMETYSLCIAFLKLSCRSAQYFGRVRAMAVSNCASFLDYSCLSCP